MKKFCYRCGSLEEWNSFLINGLCQRCFSQSALMQVPREVEVIVCPVCSAYKHANKWEMSASRDSTITAVIETIFDKLRVNSLIESGVQLLRPSEARDIKISIEPNLKGNYAKVTAVGRLHSLQVMLSSEETMVRFKLKKITCKLCSLKRARHYEAILQVRGQLPEDIFYQILKNLEVLAESVSCKEPNHFIAEVEEQKGGLDFHVSTLSLARKMAAALKSRHDVTVSESSKLIGQTRDGKRKYRVSILARIGKKIGFKPPKR